MLSRLRKGLALSLDKTESAMSKHGCGADRTHSDRRWLAFPALQVPGRAITRRATSQCFGASTIDLVRSYDTEISSSTRDYYSSSHTCVSLTEQSW